MRDLFALVALSWSAAIAFAADPVGTSGGEGGNPRGGSKYTGAVTVEQTGETYRVTWVVGDVRFIGTGIGDKNFNADGGNWDGAWAYAGGRRMGTEIWKRQ